MREKKKKNKYGRDKEVFAECYEKNKNIIEWLLALKYRINNLCLLGLATSHMH